MFVLGEVCYPIGTAKNAARRTTLDHRIMSLEAVWSEMMMLATIRGIVFKLGTVMITVALYLLLAPLRAQGTESSSGQNIRQMYHTSWTIREGAPSGITSIAQTTDGYLWLGTEDGLFRFDGITFERYQSSSGGDLISGPIADVDATPDGGLWVGYHFGGASFLKEGRIKNYTSADGLSAGSIGTFANDMQGNVWAATSYGIEHLVGSRWSPIGSAWDDPYDHPDTIFLDRQGTLWASTRKGLLFLPRGQANFHSASSFVAENADIQQAPNGVIWMAASNDSVRAITALDGKLTPNGPAIHISSDGILFDSKGALWITTIGQGLLRVPSPDRLLEDRTAPQRFSEKDGLTSDFSFKAIEDREGSIWVATTKGLDQLRTSALTPVNLPQGATYISMVSDAAGRLTIGSDTVMRVIDGNARPVVGAPAHIECAYRDPSGAIWLGGQNGLWRVSGKQFISYPLPAGLNAAGHNVQAMTMDRSGSLWVSFVRNGVFRLVKKSWTRSGNMPGLPQIPAITELTDTMGRIWFGYSGSRLALLDGTRISTFGAKDGLDVGDVTAIYEHKGQIWIGGEAGLEFLAQGRFRQLDLTNKEPLKGVSGIVVAANEDLWLNETSGVVHIAADEVKRAQANSQYRVQYEFLNYLDGLVSPPEGLRPLPTALQAADGRIYFATRGSVVWLDPSHLHRNAVPPPVSIQSIIADGKQHRDISDLHLPPDTGTIEINYAALSLLIPQRVRFRYKLDGVDPDWQEAGSRRRAVYSRLPPGNYTFRVIACNNDGVWNETGARFLFTIPPSFVEGLWFKAFCAVAAVGLLWGLYLIRLRQVTGQVRARAYERLVERERIARNLHDTFFQSIQGLLLRVQTGTSKLRSDEPARAILEDALRQSDRVMLEGRELVLDLRTCAEYSDLRDLLVAAGNELQKTYPAKFKTIVNGEPQPLSPIVLEEAYRLGREALSNAFRHANAQTIETELNYDPNELRIRVRDDGIGIDSTVLNDGHRAGHWGLPGMRERAEKMGARFEVWSRLNSGTEVQLRIPAATAYQSKGRKVLPRWLRMVIGDIDRLED
jgi:ligand-binding sensor domain-containing protein